MKKLLLIEDDLVLRENIAEILLFSDFDVITASNGLEGVALAKSNIPDIIISDIMMPELNGHEVLDILANDKCTKFIPFIFLSAKIKRKDVRKGMNMGANDFITKPFEEEELISAISIQLYNEKLRKQSEKIKLETLQHNISFAIPHELLTPLNGIIGLSSLMKNPEMELDENEVRDFASGIFDSGHRLLDTIQNFINYTKVELLLNNEEKKASLKKEITETGEHELEEQSLIIAQKFNRESDIELHIKSFNAKISSFHFQIIINNILDNAFKFSNKEDKVIVEVELDDSHVHITVIDKGLGFDEGILNEIGAFTQFNRAKMEQQGLGLGLITSKKLINFYEGELVISKNKPSGSCVKLSFLLAK